MLNALVYFLQKLKPLLPILKAVSSVKGTSYLVGGSVRDLILDMQIKDIDIEVHGLSIDELQKVLANFGIVELVGKQFGVLRVHPIDVDWSVPRKDSIGRKPTVEMDPNMSLPDAFRRRDITINAMGIKLDDLIPSFDQLLQKAQKHDIFDITSFVTIVDPFNGLQDLKSKTLRAVDTELFLEDPLRFFRVMQFLARFEMQPDEQLNQLCKTMELKDPVTSGPLARERIFDELKKLFLKSKKPSLGFKWLHEVGRLQELFPELHATIFTQQRPDFHPEGNVFEHTMQALDAAAGNIEELPKEESKEKLIIVLSALCHDLGKVTTTDDQLHAYGHEDESEKIAKKMLKRFTDDIKIIKSVSLLVKHHMKPFAFIREGAKPKAYKRLAKKLALYTNMQQLALLARADSMGRNPDKGEPLSEEPKEYYDFLKKIDQLEVRHKPEAPVLLGRHLLDKIKPGPKMGALLNQAYEIQLEESIKDFEVLKKRVLKE